MHTEISLRVYLSARVAMVKLKKGQTRVVCGGMEISWDAGNTVTVCNNTEFNWAVSISVYDKSGNNIENYNVNIPRGTCSSHSAPDDGKTAEGHFAKSTEEQTFCTIL